MKSRSVIAPVLLSVLAVTSVAPLAGCFDDGSDDSQDRPTRTRDRDDDSRDGDREGDQPVNPYRCAIGTWRLVAETGSGGCFDDYEQDRAFVVEPTRDNSTVTISILNPLGNEVIDSAEIVGGDTNCELIVYLSRDEPELNYGYTEIYKLYSDGTDIVGDMIIVFERYRNNDICEDFFDVEGTHG